MINSSLLGLVNNSIGENDEEILSATIEEDTTTKTTQKKLIKNILHRKRKQEKTPSNPSVRSNIYKCVIHNYLLVFFGDVCLI